MLAFFTDLLTCLHGLINCCFISNCFRLAFSALTLQAECQNGHLAWDLFHSSLQGNGLMQENQKMATKWLHVGA